MRYSALAVAMATVLALPATVYGFCGFYVSGADASLYNDATVVAMMREGTRTVLSMQNSYQGPPEDFAMVVPVPVVLQKENVKTLPDRIFERLDKLAAPRLVEYWERDPCERPPRRYRRGASVDMAAEPEAAQSDEAKDLGVKIEAQFEVGEYDIVILSADDSAGLDTWLRKEEYNIPDGAEPVLRPYVESGTKFFVAKVDVERVEMEDGQAVLSPLRFHYDSDRFDLPVRLGLLNSSGEQDLIVHILARGQRYEVANYDNATIPTNIRVDDAVRENFGQFYEQLLSRTLEKHPEAVITEYAWNAATCDPCPTPALRPEELQTLGADVLPGASDAPTARRGRRPPRRGGSFVLTRLHYRYGKDDLGEDLVFKAAPPIDGGRGTPNRDGELRRETRAGGMNQFQGRYAILHRWEGEIACDNPRRGRWGGPPGSRPQPDPMAAGSRLRRGGGSGGGAKDDSAASDKELAALVRDAIPALDLTPAAKAQARETEEGQGADEQEQAAAQEPQQQQDDDGCDSCVMTGATLPRGLGTGLPVVAALLLVRARRRRRR